MPARQHAHLLAQCLARAINPGLASEDAPVAAALLQPVALRAVQLLAAGGYTLTRTTPQPVEAPERPTLRHLPDSWTCHKNGCGCDDNPA